MADNFEAPQSRNEALLQDILGAENPIGEPQSRNEAILTAILEGLDEIPAPYVDPPQSRIEELLVELWENGGGQDDKFKSLVERSIATITAEDLAGITSIGTRAFSACGSLTSVVIPDNVVNLGSQSFGDNQSLKNVTIGTGVTSIGAYCFSGCSMLLSVTINATTPPSLLNVNAFNNTNDCPIYVPASSVDAYKAATNWASLASRIQAIPNA